MSLYTEVQTKFDEFMDGSKPSKEYRERKNFDLWLENVTIREDEAIECVAPVTSSKFPTIPGILILTSKRIIVTLATTWRSDGGEFPLSRISSVSYTTLFMVLNVQGDEKKYGRCHGTEKLVKAIQNQIYKFQEQEQSQQSNSNQDDMLSKIERLHNLKQQGAISESEYEVLKQEIFKKA